MPTGRYWPFWSLAGGVRRPAPLSATVALNITQMKHA
jgi:hypothetical protein